MNDGEKPSRRSSGMYFLKVGNQVASEGEERSEATGGSWEEKARPLGVGNKKARPLEGVGNKKARSVRELGRKKRDHWGRKAYRKYVVCHARFFKIFP